MPKQLDHMIPGFRRVGAARCQVREAEMLPVHMRKGTRLITDVYTEPEHAGKGYATTLMHSICREADQMNIMLILQPEPFGHASLPREELEVWYTVRFGFQMIQVDPPLFARMPGGTPRSTLRLNPVTQAVIKAAQ